MKKHTKKRLRYGERFTLFLFLAFLVSLLFILDAVKKSEETVSTERVLKKLVINTPSDDGIGFVIKDQRIDRVDNERLLRFASMDYEQIKAELGLTYDFTLYFEDENGNVVPIGNKHCIGSPKAMVGGVNCG